MSIPTALAVPIVSWALVVPVMDHGPLRNVIFATYPSEERCVQAGIWVLGVGRRPGSTLFACMTPAELRKFWPELLE